VITSISPPGRPGLSSLSRGFGNKVTAPGQTVGDPEDSSALMTQTHTMKEIDIDLDAGGLVSHNLSYSSNLYKNLPQINEKGGDFPIPQRIIIQEINTPIKNDRSRTLPKIDSHRRNCQLSQSITERIQNSKIGTNNASSLSRDPSI